jgi:hypothetical protein
VEHPLIASIIETGTAKFGDGAGAGGRIDKDGDDGAIAETDRAGCIEGLEQSAGLGTSRWETSS